MEDQPTSSTPGQDKQVTVAVPEERVAEFYAWFARFLGGRRRRPGRGPRGHRHDGCRGRETTEAAAPDTPVTL